MDRNGLPVLKFISPVLIFANVPANGKLCGPVSSHKKVNLGPSIPRQGETNREKRAALRWYFRRDNQLWQIFPNLFHQ